MAFFDELIRNIELTPTPDKPRAQARTAAVLQYAPRRLRAEKGEPAARADLEIAYWRERAYRAEAQLVTLGARVRRIASMARRGD